MLTFRSLLLLTGTPLGVPSLIGMLMLVGIVVTNAIVLIDLINQFRRSGCDLLEAVIEGAVSTSCWYRRPLATRHAARGIAGIRDRPPRRDAARSRDRLADRNAQESGELDRTIAGRSSVSLTVTR